MKDTQVRSAAEFKRTETVKLPSGLEIEARKPDIMRLIAEAPEDSVPVYLIEQFSGVLGQSVPNPVVETPMEALRKTSKLMDIAIKSAVIWPVISSDPIGDDQISVSDLSMDDRQFIFTWAMPKPKPE